MPSLEYSRRSLQEAKEQNRLAPIPPKVDMPVPPITAPYPNPNTSGGPLPALSMTDSDLQRVFYNPAVPQERFAPVAATNNAVVGAQSATQTNIQVSTLPSVAISGGTASVGPTITVTPVPAPGTQLTAGVSATVAGNLDQLPDGTARFGQTGSGLSYRPTTNMLTAHDAGSNATINVASFTNRTSSKGDVSVNSGSVTTLSYSTVYYVSYDDSTLAGGAVTFHTSTTRDGALQGAGRFFIGSITTPASGAGDTIGNNDGGASAQIGQKSTSFSTSATGTFSSVTTSPGSGTGTENDILAGTVQEIWSGWPAANFGPSSIALNITSSVAITGASGHLTGKMEYSLDGGSTYTTVYSVTNNRAATTDVITLLTTQDLTQVKVRATVTYNSGATVSMTMSITGINILAQG